MRFLLLAVLAGIAMAAGTAAAASLKVVASFSILADMVREVGGQHVTVTALVGPDADAHVFEPSPAHARALAEADLVVVNGLGFEGWMDRLIRASGYKGPVITATTGITPIYEDGGQGHHHGHAHGHHRKAGRTEAKRIDPHAWQSVTNALIYTDNIADGLRRTNSAIAEDVNAGADRYKQDLRTADLEIRRALAAVPEARRKIITSHDAFGYYGQTYGLRLLAPVGMNTEAEPSAADVAALIRQIRQEKATAIFIENITNPRLMEQIAREGGVWVGGVLYSDALSPADGPAPTYLRMIRYNTEQIVQALQGQ